MKIFTRLTPALALGALFIGCGADLTETSNTDAQVKGSILFVTKDSETGATLDSVSFVRLQDGNDKVVMTDSAGQVIFKSLDNGDYLFEVSKSGYATLWSDVSLNLENQDSDAPRIYDEVVPLSMYELGAEVGGKVYYVDKDGNKQVAAGAAVELTVSSIFKKKLYTATADSVGVYSFTDLPENVSYTIKVLKYTDADDIVYNTSSFSVNGVKAGETRTLNSVSVTIDAKPFERLSDNLDVLKESDSISIKFSEPVNVSAIEKNDMRVLLSGDLVAADFSWSSDKMTLTVKTVSGKWKNGSTYSLVLDLLSAEGDDYTSSESFSTKTSGSLADIAASAITYIAYDTNEVNADDNSVTLYWNEIANADGYEVYVKDYSDSTFNYVTSSTDTVASINTNGLFTKGRDLELMVVAYNGTSRASFATAGVKTLKDNVDAAVTNETIPTTFNGFDNTGSLPDTTTYTVSFDNAMDTTTTATLTAVSSLNGLLSLGQKWKTKTLLYVYVIVPGIDASAATGSAKVDLSTVTDEAGNPVNSAEDTYQITVEP